MRVVILTASTMKKLIGNLTYSGKCITALSLDGQRIYRFVMNEQGAPIGNPFCERFHPLDVFDITVLKECPLLCQTENVLVDYRNAKHIGQFPGTIDDLFSLFQSCCFDGSFMFDGFHKLDDISSYNHSLEMIRVENMIIEGRKCEFKYHGRHFRFVSLTDPDYTQAEGKLLEIGAAVLVVSIPTTPIPEMGYYKFVASVFRI